MTGIPAACPHPCSTAITPRALRRACPIKLKVSSTRPAPHNGLESSAARSARAPNPFVRAASSTVRSTSRRSRSDSISRLRNPTRAPLENGGSSAPMQSRTSCQRRSITVASITSSSLTFVYACRIVASASRAGGTGGCPFGLSTYVCASSSWNCSSSSSWRCSRKNTNSLARRTALITARSAGEGSTGGRHTTGRTTFLPIRNRSFTNRYDRE
jgi:hypothetical protein